MSITLIGVGHVFNIGDAVRRIIFEERPNAVCLELDDERLTALMAGKRNEGAPSLYRSLSDFQSRMAEKYGTTVGSEMLAAHDAAGLLGAETYCIDMKASEFFSRAFGSMTVREKISFVLSSFAARFTGRRRMESEMKAVQEDDGRYIEVFARRFPSLKRVLIDERNQHMAEAIRQLASEGRDVVAVIGDGHISGISASLADLSPKVIRLKELRGLAAPGSEEMGQKPGGGNSQVSFSYSMK